jgi:adenine/guanine phosphoribosyltransferase-like PRPP-binding protein
MRTVRSSTCALQTYITRTIEHHVDQYVNAWTTLRSTDKQCTESDLVVKLSSELHVIEERMSRIESLLSRIVSPEELEQFNTTSSASTCGTCGTRLTPSESMSGLKNCRNCRVKNVSELMDPREPPTPSSVTRQGPASHCRVERIQEALDVIELLALAKQYYTYNELEQVLGLPTTVLARYVKGHVLPVGKRGREIRRSLLEAVKLGMRVNETLREYGGEAISQVNMNPRLMWFIVQHIVYLNAGRRITKVLTATEQGVPLATLVSYRLRVPLIVATPYKRTGTRKTIEAELTSDAQRSIDPYVRTIHISCEALKKNDCVLIITDRLSDGSAQAALEKLVLSARASVVAIWTTIVTTDAWMRTECPIDSFTKLNSPEENDAAELLTPETGNGE